MSPGCFEDIEERHKVGAIVHYRFCNRLAYSLECRKMNDSVYLVFLKKSGHRCIITTFDPIERYIVSSGYLLDSFKTGEVTIGHIIRYHHLISCRDEFDCHMAANVACTAGYQYCLCHINVMFIQPAKIERI